MLLAVLPETECQEYFAKNLIFFIKFLTLDSNYVIIIMQGGI